jgi:hypothetical protein
MNKIPISIVVQILIISCTDDAVTIVKEPGILTGIILPLDVNAKAKLVQGDSEKISEVEANGKFQIKNIDPGVYTFVASANNFGSVKRENIKIEDGEGFEIGTIELDTIPYPLIGFYGLTSSRSRYYVKESYISLRFSKFMNITTLENSITISPEVKNWEISTNSSLEDFTSYYYIFGEFEDGIEYTVELDSSCETYWGEKLEFPYTYKIKQSIDPFIITEIDTGRIENSHSRINISFSKSIQDNFNDFISIEPYIALINSNSNDRNISYIPVNSWIPDTQFNLTISNLLEDKEGNKLGTDTTISFTTPPLQILATSPIDQQILFSELNSIRIMLNFMIDTQTFLTEECITIEPAIEFTKGLISSFSRPQLGLFFEEVEAKTEYTVTINTKLKDYWGKNLKELYIFKFKTM